MRLHETESRVTAMKCLSKKKVTTANGEYVKNIFIKHLNKSSVGQVFFQKTKQP